LIFITFVLTKTSSMKKKLLFASCLLAGLGYGQTTLFQDNFESGSSNWTLNGGVGTNIWVVNNSYLSASATFGFIPDTPFQPGGFTNGPNSTYLHINNTTACSALNACNANFDTGSATDQSATMTTNLSTTGFNTVTLSFHYLSGGAAGTSYGIVEYSTNNGGNWAAASAQYTGVGSWTQATLSMPEWNNQATLKFRFRWVNGAAGSDPAFSVDEITITAQSGGGPSNTITATTASASSWCTNVQTSMQVNFTASGTYTAGNVFTAQLSDATGSFASPLAIGSLAETNAGTHTINAVIPAGQTPGTGYRVRVISSNPSVEGDDNNSTLVIHPQPTISAGDDQLICSGASVTLSGSGGVSYMWNNDVVNGVAFSPTQSNTYTVTGTDGNGCTNTDQVTILVETCAGLEENVSHFRVYPNPAKEQLHITFNDTKPKRIILTHLDGKLVKELNAQAYSHDISNLSTGVYLLIIESSKELWQQKIIVQ
jgi:hypothetical protein